MAHNIEGFAEYFTHLKTKKFNYKKGNWSEWITIDNKVKVIAETEKAILIREKIQKDKEMYSTTSMWIPKSRIIELNIRLKEDSQKTYDGCCGKYVYSHDEHNDYFDCIVEVYICDNCGYKWNKIKE